MDIQIENGVDIPDFATMPRTSGGRDSKFPFDKMTSVGQSFAVPFVTDETSNGNATDTLKRMRGLVNARNSRDPRKTFNLLKREENGQTVVRVWLTAVNPDATPKPRVSRSKAVANVQPEPDTPAPAPEAAPATAPESAPATAPEPAPAPAATGRMTAAQRAAAAATSR